MKIRLFHPLPAALALCSAIAPVYAQGTAPVLSDPVIIEAPALEALPAPHAADGLRPEATGVTPPVRHRMSEIVMQALSLLGMPYRWGGTSTTAGFDCSGLVRHVVEQALGLVLPRSAIAMSRLGMQVERPSLQPGDLLFFVTRKRDVSHVGIYVGEGRFVHANRTGGEVTVSDLDSRYWSRRFVAARRVNPE